MDDRLAKAQPLSGPDRIRTCVRKLDDICHKSAASCKHNINTQVPTELSLKCKTHVQTCKHSQWTL